MSRSGAGEGQQLVVASEATVESILECVVSDTRQTQINDIFSNVACLRYVYLNLEFTIFLGI